MAKTVKLLFNDTKNQCLHIHSTFSGDFDNVSSMDTLDFLDRCREEANKMEKVDGVPNLLVAITDFNSKEIYEGLSYNEIRKNNDYKPVDEKMMKRYYGLNRKERKQILCEENIKIITGSEVSGMLNNVKVHTLALDFNEDVFGLFRYTKKSYRYSNKRADVKTISKATKLSGGKLVLTHPSRYVKEGKISLNDILMAAYKSKAFDAIECANSNMSIEDSFKVLKFCAAFDIPVTAGTDYRYKGRESKANGNKQTDIFTISSLNMKCSDFLNLVVGKNIDELNVIEEELKKKMNQIKR